MSVIPKAGLASSLVLLAILAAWALAPGRSADARPQYKKAFDGKYSKTLKKTNCFICHDKENPEDKKKHNAYGKAVKASLPGKINEKDAKKVAKMLDEAAKKDSGTEGKTFGDLIKDGKRPAGDDE